MKYLKPAILFIFLISLQSFVAKAQVVTIPITTSEGKPVIKPGDRAVSTNDSIPVTTLVERNSKLNMDFPVEKVYVHFDKPYYAIGDTIWFKSYVTTIQNLPSPLSKVVYIDVINERDSLVETVKLPIRNSVAAGSIALGYDHYSQGNYRVRAYTRWMLNFNSSYYFTHNLPVGNSINKELSTHIKLDNQFSDKKNDVKVGIKFRDEENKTLKNKRVNWEVMADFDRIGRGKETTDEYGFVSFDFNSTKDVPLREGSLEVSIETDKREFLAKKIPLKTLNVKNDVQFFPEGGALVAELPTQIGFKAIKSTGLGIEMTGEIVDAAGTSITSFSSEHFGMGKFLFTPQKDQQYFANVNFSDGSKGTYALPKVEAEGINLVVDNNDPLNLRFNIQSNSAYLTRNLNKSFYIIGRSGGVVYYAAQSGLKNQVHTGSVPKNNFPSGIAQLSIVSPTGKVLSERLAFINVDDTLTLNVKNEKASYGTRQQVKMKMSALLGDSLTKGEFSVAVIDESKVPFDEDNENTIWSSLLLESDIEGYIEKPNYYFLAKHEDRFSKLDLLLLTQGYRRYEYKDIAADKEPEINMLPEQSLSISGIIRRGDGMPLKNSAILLQIPEKSFYKDGSTDDKGRFVFTDLIFQDSVEAVVNARAGSSIKNMMINVDGEPYPSINKNSKAAAEILNIDSALGTYLENSKLQNSTGFLLKDVQVEGRQAKKPSHADHSALSGLSMMADYTTDGDQLAGCSNLLNCLSTVMGLTYLDNQVYISRTYNSGNRTPAEIYVDGMPVDASYLYSLQPAGVASIEVFLSDGLTGINQRSGTSGVVVVNMKEIKRQKVSREELNELFAPTSILKFNPKGYSEDRVFYVPRFEGPRSSLQATDRRSTIHWSPLIALDNKEEAELVYFTADDKGTYRVVVEGIDENGHLGRKVLRYQVE